MTLVKNEEVTQRYGLPELCYVGSLPVEATSASMALLYRLLEEYPPEKLRIIHLATDKQLKIREDRRLPRVQYFTVRPLVTRGWYFARMRLPSLFLPLLKMNARVQRLQISPLLGAFKPKAVLTIHEQFGWLTAKYIAEHYRSKLHLVLHDDWLRNIPMPLALSRALEAYFSRTYRSADSRLCISPFMESSYRTRYGASGQVLYPSRSRSAKVFLSPKPPGNSKAGISVAYGGNVFHQGYWDSLRFLAQALASVNGTLHLFGPSKEEIAKQGLESPNVVAHGFVFEMTEAIRHHADVVFLPMSFDKREETNMRVSFPSKLTEYTAAGLPMLIHGPEYCSAVRWAKGHPDSAEVATESGLAPLQKAIHSLSDPNRRAALAVQAIALGSRYFSPEAANTSFLNAILANQHI